MPTPQDYIISFDFTAFTNQFSQLQRSYTDFGSLIRKVSESASQDISTLSDQTKNLYSDLSRLNLALDASYGAFSSKMRGTVDYLDDLDKKTASISSNMNKMSGVGLGALVGAGAGLPQDKDTAEERLSDVMPDKGDAGTKDLLGAVEEANKKADAALSGKTEGGAGGGGKAISILEKEGAGARKAAASAASQITGGAFGGGGGIIGMLIGFMLLGKMDETRKAAESGEMMNVFEAGFDSLNAAVTQSAIKDLSSFQEIAQKKYGIGRKEVQAVAKDFIDAGIRAKDMMKNVSSSLGEVGEDVVKLSLGVDKLFNMSTGTSSGKIVELMTDYGDTLEEASKKYLRVASAAQESGIGVQKFIDSVYSGSQALKQYGIDLEDVSNVMRTIQKQYESMGLTEEKAGSLAGEGVSNLTTAIQNMSQDKKRELAMVLFPGKDASSALMEFEQGFMRAKEGKDEGFFLQIGAAMQRKVNSSGSRREDQLEFARAYYGLNYQGFSAVVDTKWGDIKSFGKGSPKGLKESFDVEGKTMSELEKMQYDLIQGLATIGRGILKVLVGILGAVVTGFRMMYMSTKLSLTDFDSNERIYAEMDRLWSLQTSSLTEGLNDLLSGSDKTLGALGGLFDNIAHPLAEALKPAPLVPGRPEDEGFSDVPKSKLGDLARYARAGDAGNYLDEVNKQLADSIKAGKEWAEDTFHLDKEGPDGTKLEDAHDAHLWFRGKNQKQAAAKPAPPASVPAEFVIPGSAVRQSLNNQNKALVVPEVMGY